MPRTSSRQNWVKTRPGSGSSAIGDPVIVMYTGTATPSTLYGEGTWYYDKANGKMYTETSGVWVQIGRMLIEA